MNSVSFLSCITLAKYTDMLKFFIIDKSSDLYADSAPFPIQHPCLFCTLQARGRVDRHDTLTWTMVSKTVTLNHGLVVSKSITLHRPELWSQILPRYTDLNHGLNNHHNIPTWTMDSKYIMLHRPEPGLKYRHGPNHWLCINTSALVEFSSNIRQMI